MSPERGPAAHSDFDPILTRGYIARVGVPKIIRDGLTAVQELRSDDWLHIAERFSVAKPTTAYADNYRPAFKVGFVFVCGLMQFLHQDGAEAFERELQAIQNELEAVRAVQNNEPTALWQGSRDEIDIINSYSQRGLADPDRKSLMTDVIEPALSYLAKAKDIPPYQEAQLRPVAMLGAGLAFAVADSAAQQHEMLKMGNEIDLLEKDPVLFGQLIDQLLAGE